MVDMNARISIDKPEGHRNFPIYCANSHFGSNCKRRERIAKIADTTPYGAIFQRDHAVSENLTACSAPARPPVDYLFTRTRLD